MIRSFLHAKMQFSGYDEITMPSPPLICPPLIYPPLIYPPLIYPPPLPSFPSLQANLIKESIRMGYNDLGDFFHSRGDLQAAFRCFARTRDYCITTKHNVAMCLNVIRVCIELGHFANVSNYVQKAERDVQDPVVLAKLRCAAGIAAVDSRKYKVAARKVRTLHRMMAAVEERRGISSGG